MRTNYTFIVLTACHNVEHDFEEAVQSLLNQDADFEEHIQPVHVDDGSTDGTGAIDDKDARQYPDNIEVIYQSNAGAAAAGNVGSERVKGEWGILMDADDKFPSGFYHQGEREFAKLGRETSVPVVPICFEGRKGARALKHIYKKAAG